MEPVEKHHVPEAVVQKELLKGEGTPQWMTVGLNHFVFHEPHHSLRQPTVVSLWYCAEVLMAPGRGVEIRRARILQQEIAGPDLLHLERPRPRAVEASKRLRSGPRFECRQAPLPRRHPAQALDLTGLGPLQP